jgi:hypothetical protein
MAAICVPMMRLPTQRRKYMPKTTTIEHTSVLEMALVGYEIQRNRIEAVIAEIQAELGQGGPSRSISPATASASPKPTRKKRFSVAARTRMALAQKKRWQLLKAKKAPAKKTQPTAPVKRKKAVVKASRKKTAAKPKVAVKKAVPKPKAVKRIVKPKVESVAKPPKLVSETPVPNVETETPVAIVTE